MYNQDDDWKQKNWEPSNFESIFMPQNFNITTSGYMIDGPGYVKKRSIIQLILHINPNKRSLWK